MTRHNNSHFGLKILKLPFWKHSKPSAAKKSGNNSIQKTLNRAGLRKIGR
jgi:hypothetical protein